MNTRKKIIGVAILSAIRFTACSRIDEPTRVELFSIGERVVYVDEISQIKLDYLRRDFIIEEVMNNKLREFEIEVDFEYHAIELQESKDPMHLKLIIVSNAIASETGRDRGDVLKEIFKEVEAYENSD